MHSVNEFDFGEFLVFFLEGCGGRVHLGVRLLHVVDLVVFPLLVPGDLPIAVVHVQAEAAAAPDAPGATRSVATVLTALLTSHVT